MEEYGVPASEFAIRLSVTSGKNVTSVAVKMRLHRRNIKPFKYIGSTGLYREEDFDAIKDAYLGKHPVTKDNSKNAPKAKAKKPTKKN
jgi:hypothetical protein